MDPFVEQLKKCCTQFPTRSKWVLVPTHAIGHTLGERLVLEGTNWLNLRFVTRVVRAVPRNEHGEPPCRCWHGLATNPRHGYSRRPKVAEMEPGLVKFVEFLDRNKIRATYRAVAEAAGVPVRSMGVLLGDKCPLASWVVNDRTEEPTDYAPRDKDPDLHLNSEIIRTSEDLIRRMRREKR